MCPSEISYNLNKQFNIDDLPEPVLPTSKINYFTYKDAGPFLLLQAFLQRIIDPPVRILIKKALKSF